uniref:Uncharacterized protein n=1 Tax=Caenorhabditis japonica TaxID=281687 RepID=A0A8R1IL42_CAEJA
MDTHFFDTLAKVLQPGFSIDETSCSLSKKSSPISNRRLEIIFTRDDQNKAPGDVRRIQNSAKKRSRFSFNGIFRTRESTKLLSTIFKH